jgi:hypothetical protein
MFGLTGPEGNHGEDVKECWWYLDSTPTHSWMTWRYHYPQRPFPYAELVQHGRSPAEPEYELVDTGVLAEDRYWAVTVDYAKADSTDLCLRITVENRGPEAATLHVLPTLWFRNTWAWGLPGQDAMPRMSADGGGTLVAEHAELGGLVLTGEPGGVPVLCDNETNTERLWGTPGRSRYPKDGINDHVVHGAPTIATAAYDKGLWNDDDGFFYDVLSTADGRRLPMRVRSMVGLLPLCATTTLGTETRRTSGSQSRCRAV